jgi:hypothetical protein
LINAAALGVRGSCFVTRSSLTEFQPLHHGWEPGCTIARKAPGKLWWLVAAPPNGPHELTTREGGGWRRGHTSRRHYTLNGPPAPVALHSQWTCGRGRREVCSDLLWPAHSHLSGSFDKPNIAVQLYRLHYTAVHTVHCALHTVHTAQQCTALQPGETQPAEQLSRWGRVTLQAGLPIRFIWQ